MGKYDLPCTVTYMLAHKDNCPFPLEARRVLDLFVCLPGWGSFGDEEEQRRMGKMIVDRLFFEGWTAPPCAQRSLRCIG